VLGMEVLEQLGKRIGHGAKCVRQRRGNRYSHG
jgi:hypothetical protein